MDHQPSDPSQNASNGSSGSPVHSGELLEGGRAHCRAETVICRITSAIEVDSQNLWKRERKLTIALDIQGKNILRHHPLGFVKCHLHLLHTRTLRDHNQRTRPHHPYSRVSLQAATLIVLAVACLFHRCSAQIQNAQREIQAHYFHAHRQFTEMRRPVPLPPCHHHRRQPANLP